MNTLNNWPAKVILFDRDGTLIENVVANKHSSLVLALPGAQKAVERARLAGFRLGVITNQAAIGRGQLSWNQLLSVNKQVDELFGGFESWNICPHVPEDLCDCRKPAPGMIVNAAEFFGVSATECVVVGDRITDVEAARRAGSYAVLVPSRDTRAEEVRDVEHVVQSLKQAVELILTRKGQDCANSDA